MKPNSLIRAGIVLALVALSSAASAVTVDGSYRIVIPDDDKTGLSSAIREAARALQHDIEESTGLKLAVVTASRHVKGERAIFLGPVFAEMAGLMPSGEKSLRHFENIRAEKGGDIYIFGADRACGRKPQPWLHNVVATVKGVTNFMEDQMGVRFLLPGVTGRDVPTRPKLEVPDGLHVRQTPRLRMDSGRVYEMMYSVANNVFGSACRKSYGGHTYPAAAPVEKYYRDHPEYYAQIGGGRQHEPGNPALCWSHPRVRELIEDEIAARFDEGYEIVELGQNDGGVRHLRTLSLRFRREVRTRGSELLCLQPDDAGPGAGLAGAGGGVLHAGVRPGRFDDADLFPEAGRAPAHA